MKKFYLLLILGCSAFLLNAQCDFPNPSFEEWTDQTMTFDDEMILAPGTIPLPDDHVSVFRFLTMFFAQNFLDPNDPDYEDLYMELYSYGFGVFESSDAHTGDAALRIGGDEVITGSDLYTVFPCSETPESITFSYKHVGEGADTLNIYGYTILGFDNAPQDSADLLTIPGYIDHYIYVDSTQMDYTTVTIPYNVNNADPVDTTVHYFIVSGNEAFFATGEQSYFLIDDVTYNLPGQADADMDGFNASVDCDDNDPNVNPDAEEICDGIDNNCDGMIDQGVDTPAPIVQCMASGTDFVVFQYDINPDVMDYMFTYTAPMGSDPIYNGNEVRFENLMPGTDVTLNVEAIYPGMCGNFISTLVCSSLSLADEDMDGYDTSEDCDDMNPNINPGATEIPNNDVDEDCDGIAQMIDEDMDGFNSDEDCDDSNAAINPDAVEIPNNDVDEDCDGIAQMIDDDMDGYNSDEDCDDNNAAINPGATEIPNNNVDEDCDGVALIIDEDMDGYNSDEDCDDSNPNINPGAVEIPNNDIDENCDGIIVPNFEIEAFAFVMYPNPVHDILTIEVDRKVTVSIFNYVGKKMVMDQSINGKKTISMNQLNSGYYMVQLRDQEGNQVMRRIAKF